MSNTVGFVLLGSSSAPAVIAWDLSRRGLDKVSTASATVEEAAKETKEVAKEATTALAEATPDATTDTAATNTAAVVEKADELTSGVSSVNSALEKLTGNFAPARVFAALAFLLILASFVALDVITLGT
jgi:saccharopine dehydrogenase-like NADP-dependent oxidoreductase